MPERKGKQAPRNRRQRTAHRRHSHKKQGASPTSLGGSLKRVLLFLGIPGFLYGLFWSAQPSVNIEVRDPVEVTLPLSVSFPITNNGRFAVYDVFSTCVTNHVLTTAETVVYGNAARTVPPPGGNMLGQSQTLTVQCGAEVRGQAATDIQIDVGVMFRPKFLPFRYLTCSRFQLQRESLQHPRLLEYPIADCEPLFTWAMPKPLPEDDLFPPNLWFW